MLRGRILGGAFLLSLAFVLSLALSSGAMAQDGGVVAPDLQALSPILSLDQDALFSRSKFGQALRANLAEKATKAEAESRRLDTELEAEERALTQTRAGMTPEDFAPLAAAFDQKVQRLRAERAAAAEALSREEADARRRFLQAAAQVIGDYMVQRGASAIIDKSAIIVSLIGLDVTDAVISKLDETLGDGSDLGSDLDSGTDADPN